MRVRKLLFNVVSVLSFSYSTCTQSSTFSATYVAVATAVDVLKNYKKFVDVVLLFKEVI